MSTATSSSYSQFLGSDVYAQAMSTADTWCFWVELVVSICLIIFYDGWHLAVEYPVHRDVAAFTILCVAVRVIQLQQPALYSRWRLVFMRALRGWCLVTYYAGLPRFIQLHRRGRLADRVTMEMFGYYKQRIPSTWESLRLVAVVSGAAMGLSVRERILPLLDQALVQGAYLFIQLTWMLPPLAAILAMPSFAPATLEVCHLINSGTHFNPFMMNVGPEAMQVVQPESCQQPAAAARRVVIYLNVLLLFVVPVYCMYCYERGLRRKYRMLQWASRHQHDPDRGVADLPDQLPWVQQVCIDLVVVYFLATLLWYCVADYDEAIAAGLEWVGGRVEWGFAWVFSLLQ